MGINAHIDLYGNQCTCFGNTWRKRRNMNKENWKKEKLDVWKGRPTWQLESSSRMLKDKRTKIGSNQTANPKPSKNTAGRARQLLSALNIQQSASPQRPWWAEAGLVFLHCQNNSNNHPPSWVQWCTALIPVHTRRRQIPLWEFQVSLVYTVRARWARDT